MPDLAQLDAARRRMLDEQLRGRGIHAHRVLAAMGRTPRERFMPADASERAYSDCALAIDCGQTISQPYMVALMTQALELTGVEHVLEIGTGSGYQAAILAELAHDVVTVERHAALARQAAEILASLGYANFRCVIGDGSLGWPADAPYDRIIVTAAAFAIPQPLLDQLAPGGILVMPVGESSGQILEVVRSVNSHYRVEQLTPCRFVPLIGAAAERE